MSERKTPSIDQVEHDGSYGVRKVSNFLDNGSGGLTRQSGDTSGRSFVRISNTLVTEAHDYIVRTTPTSTSERYVFKSGGASGTVVATLDLEYDDVGLTTLLSVTKT